MNYNQLAHLSSPWKPAVHPVVVDESKSRRLLEVDARKYDCHLLDFPLELLVQIFSQLSPSDLMHARLVCRVFLAIATHDDVWKRHSEAIDSRKGGPLAPAEPSNPVWSFMLLYWTRVKSQPKHSRTLQEMVDQWTTD